MAIRAREDRCGTRENHAHFAEKGASQFLNTGRGRPVNPQPRTAALRSVGVLAGELRHRLGAVLKTEISPSRYSPSPPREERAGERRPFVPERLNSLAVIPPKAYNFFT